MDKLTTMLEMQKALQEDAYGYSFDNMPTELRTSLIKEMSIHDAQETHEMLYELPFFKPWKNYTHMTKEEVDAAMQKAKEEFVDKWHFMMNIAILLNLTADELTSMYMEKNKENYKRQQEGYTHDKSYRS